MKKSKTSGLSRRGLIAAATVAPLIATGAVQARQPTPAPPRSMLGAGADDPALELARASLALHRENERLHRRYGAVETWLADNYDWFKLMEAERRALPAGHRLYEIDARIFVLRQERPRSLRRLRRTPVNSIAGVIGKLQVVAMAMQAEDELASAARLLEATIRDLRSLQEMALPSCSRAPRASASAPR